MTLQAPISRPPFVRSSPAIPVKGLETGQSTFKVTEGVTEQDFDSHGASNSSVKMWAVTMPWTR